MAHPLDHLFGMLGQAQSCRRGDQPFATPHEEFRVELFGKVMELKTDGTGGEVNFFCGAGHAGGVHDGEKQFKLVDVHLPSPKRYRRAIAGTCDAVCQRRFFKFKSFQDRQTDPSDFAASGTNCGFAA